MLLVREKGRKEGGWLASRQMVAVFWKPGPVVILEEEVASE
jgi:hypothetical protein